MSRIQGTRPNRQSQWTPDVPPTEPDNLPTWLFNQLNNLSSTLFNINTLRLDRIYKIPERNQPRDGDLVLAEKDVLGDTAGLYYYNVDHWTFLAERAPGRKITTDRVIVDAGTSGIGFGIGVFDTHDDDEMTQTQFNSLILKSLQKGSDDSYAAFDIVEETYLPLIAGNEHKVTGTIHLDDERKINVAWGEAGKLLYDGGERLKWGNGYIWAFKPLDMQENRIVNVATPEKDKDAVNKKYVDEQAGGVPVGSIMFWLNNTPPDGWFKLHGDTFDVAKYPKLHNYFNSTEGYTSGTLPDWAGRYPVEHGDHATMGLGAMIGDRTKLPTNKPITAKTEQAYPDGSTRSFNAAGGTNAYSDGTSYFDVKLSGGDNVTRPPSVIGHYIVKHD